MNLRVYAPVVAVAVIAVGGIAGSAIAQDAGTNNSGSAPAGTQATPTPNVSKLPEVQVIQQHKKAKPKPTKQARRPKKAPATVAAEPTAPPPQPTPAIESSVEGTSHYETAPGPAEVKMSPIDGSEIPIDKVPGGVSTVSSSELARSGTEYVPDALASYVPGVILSDLQGNVFQTNVDYRGFNSSPVDGVPQGLAVYQNGVRINEAFGDTVNYDFLPTVAIESMTIMSGNPVYGLNAIGGALSIDMKNGFTYQGLETDARFGSFGREQGSIQDGMRFGNWATYIALEDIRDNGYRDFGASDIRRMYADLGVRGDDSEFHLNFTGANNSVGVAAASPLQLLDEQGWDKTFSTPQTTTNQVEMVSLNGKVRASDTVDLSGVAYYRHFNQQHVDGNISDATPCPIGSPGSTETGACFDNLDGTSILLHDTNGNLITLPNGISGLGEIDRTSVDSNSFGGSVQAVEKAPLLNHHNQFLVGASIDHGEVSFQSSAELGFFQPRFVVSGGAGFVGPLGTVCTNDADDDGFCIPGAGTALSDIRPVDISTTNTYYGAFFSDTFDATDQLAITVGGRYNIADLTIHDETGLAPDLNGSPTYSRFNPQVGATYQLFDGISLYGGYSEANRAPVAAELACADPNQPCLLPSFLTSDPPLKQVVSHTWEAGFRGEDTNILSHEKISWSLGYFRTENDDDITDVASSIIGRSSFANAGETLRQGLEAQVNYWSGRLFAYASYNFVDATFQSDLTLPSPNNPLNVNGDDDFTISVHPGDRLPGVPAHKFKAGVDYGLTSRWRVGADLIAATNQIYFGDESNQNAPLGGYAKINLHTSYDLTDNIQIYGLLDNLFDEHYGIYGTYFDYMDTNDSGASLGSITFTDPRTIIPAPPITAYGGIKVRFN
ncbi:MAG: TonB-dependent receptor [Proteobacteria bacterium]|nr:TonB-dependent receptor [Pseudomonadota bacterium]